MGPSILHIVSCLYSQYTCSCIFSCLLLEISTMAPVTSDLIQIARKSITTEPQNGQQQPQQPPIQSSKPIDNTKGINVSVKQKEIKSISSAVDTTKLPDDMKGERASLPVSSPPPQQKSNKIPLKLVNAHITCSICKGYLIDATTLVECLHSCKNRSIVFIFNLLINLL